MIKRPKGPSGTLVVLEHHSRILKDNPLGDPHVRKLGVWLPPQYDRSDGRRFPVLYDLVGFTGSGLAHTAWKPFGDNVPERAARLIHERKMGPVIIVFPDCFTALGGMVPMVNMLLGEIAPGGVGSGLYGMLVVAVIAVFVAGLLVGRTPEYLGKKIEAFEMKMAAIILLIPPYLVLIGVAAHTHQTRLAQLLVGVLLRVLLIPDPILLRPF